MSKTQSSQSVKPTLKHRTGTNGKRWRPIWMWLGVGVAAVSIAGAAGLALEFPLSPSPKFENSVAAGEMKSVGSIVLHPGEKDCQHRLFDNRTGQFAEAQTSCPNGTMFDAKGMPIPLGTVHTLNSISKSFK